MALTVQYIIIGIVVGWAGIYLIRKVSAMFRVPEDGCGGGCGCAGTELKKEQK